MYVAQLVETQVHTWYLLQNDLKYYYNLYQIVNQICNSKFLIIFVFKWFCHSCHLFISFQYFLPGSLYSMCMIYHVWGIDSHISPRCALLVTMYFERFHFSRFFIHVKIHYLVTVHIIPRNVSCNIINFAFDANLWFL